MDSGRTAPGLTIDRVPTLAVEVWRYFLVAAIAFSIDFSSLVILTSFVGIHYLLSAVFGFICGLAANYWLSVTWVFADRSLANRRAEFAIFAFIGVLGLVLNELILGVGTGAWGLDYRVSKLIAAAVVFSWNFGIRRVLLFK